METSSKEKKSMTVGDAVKQMLLVIKGLHEVYPKKQFTLDGRLLGDLGEVLVADAYQVELFEGLARHHDGKCTDGRLVQIKATMKDSLTYPVDHDPDYYIGIKISETGTFEEIYNGPSAPIREALKDRARTPNSLHSISIGRLQKLSATVASKDRIPKRTQKKPVVPLAG